jgi:Amt family ammonium transporter
MIDASLQTAVVAALLLLSQCGLALTISGFVRARSAVHGMVAVMQLSAVALVGFWLVGVHVDGSAASPDRCLVLALLASLAAIIPAGTLAERWRLTSMLVTGLAVAAAIVPLAARWIWSGGWLAELAAHGLGAGVVDFAGGGVIHVVGGSVALAGAAVLGPRSRKFTHDGRPMAMPGHQVPTLMAGAFTIAAGWAGLLGAATMLHPADSIGHACLDAMLTTSASVLAATAWMRYRLGTPDPSLVANALVAGLVASAAGCAVMSTQGAFVTGLVAGPLVVASVLFVERRLRLDDPTGAISVHGTCGAWGLLAVGLFADGTGHAAHGGQAVTGLIYGTGGQLAAQAIGLVVLAALAGGVAFVLFQVMALTVGNRVSAEAEVEGLDAAELGTVAYRDFGVDGPASSRR